MRSLCALVVLGAFVLGPAQEVNVAGTYTGKYNFSREYRELTDTKAGVALRKQLAEMSRMTMTLTIRDDYSFGMIVPTPLFVKAKPKSMLVKGIWMVRDGVLTLVATNIDGKEYMDNISPTFRVSKDGKLLSSQQGFGKSPLQLRRSQK